MSIQTNFRAQDMIGAREQKAAKKPAPVAPVVVAPAPIVEEVLPVVVEEEQAPVVLAEDVPEEAPKSEVE